MKKISDFFITDTTGHIRADIKFVPPSSPPYSFMSDAGRARMFREGGRLKVSASTFIGPLPHYTKSFIFDFPDMDADGVQRTYLVPQDVRGFYSDLVNGGSQGYTFQRGVVQARLMPDDTLIATFSLEATFGSNQAIDVTEGAIDVKGFLTPARGRKPSITAIGNFEGDFIDGPFAGEKFKATEVDFWLDSAFPQPEPMWLIVGKEIGDFPFYTRMLAVFLAQSAGPGPTYDLSDQSKATVYFLDEDTNYGAYSIGGTLTLSHHPASARAKGTINAKVQMNNDLPFKVIAAFDITL